MPPAPKAPEKKPHDTPDRIILVSYPKIMFLYPTVLTALFCGLVMWFKGGLPETAVLPEKPAAAADAAADQPAADAPAPAIAGPTYHYVCARFFLAVFVINLVVIAFDFPRTTSLTWFFAAVAISIGLYTLFRFNEGLLPKVVDGLLSVRPAANTSFYFIYTFGMLFLYICVLISRRFDYWEVKGNELLHHHGFLSDLKRFSAPNLRIDKEINDVFEYMLLRSGRLIIHPSNERLAVVLENVIFINAKEEKITKMLGALQVRVRTEEEL
ncbi:MAG: hypothetical protein JNL58_01620 [Planctomyces sp.]|nr:hypothetical protein [Planctomyces sp.]